MAECRPRSRSSPDNRVRLTVQVPSHDVHHAIEHAATDLAKTAKIPGFRKGKVPHQVLVQHIGSERLWPRRSRATSAAGSGTRRRGRVLRPVAQPEYDFELPESESQDWQFTATFPCRRSRSCPTGRRSRSARSRPKCRTSLSSRSSTRCAHRRRARAGRGTARRGRRHRDRRSRLAEGETRATTSSSSAAAPSSTRSSRASSASPPARRRRSSSSSATVEAVGHGHRQGDQGEGAARVDDELARAASEFETLTELRADIETRLREQIEEETEAQFRADVVDALVAASNVQLPGRSSRRARASCCAASRVRSRRAAFRSRRISR